MLKQSLPQLQAKAHGAIVLLRMDLRRANARPVHGGAWCYLPQLCVMRSGVIKPEHFAGKIVTGVLLVIDDSHLAALFREIADR